MATAGTSRLRLSSRTSHFVLPKQWASMRKAEALEKETGKRVIHFEKGDFQGDEFYPAPTSTKLQRARYMKGTSVTFRVRVFRNCVTQSPRRPPSAAAPPSAKKCWSRWVQSTP